MRNFSSERPRTTLGHQTSNRPERQDDEDRRFENRGSFLEPGTPGLFDEPNDVDEELPKRRRRKAA